MIIQLYNDDMVLSQGVTLHDHRTNWTGNVAIMHIKWTNHVLTCGEDRLMRGCHVEVSHCPIMDKVV
jgi:hypothetical protein